MNPALKEGEHYYIDPETGYLVFTEKYHLLRGYCCKNRCRHCPYGNAPNNNSDNQSKYPADQPGK